MPGKTKAVEITTTIKTKTCKTVFFLFIVMHSEYALGSSICYSNGPRTVPHRGFSLNKREKLVSLFCPATLSKSVPSLFLFTRRAAHQPHYPHYVGGTIASHVPLSGLTINHWGHAVAHKHIR